MSKIAQSLLKIAQSLLTTTTNLCIFCKSVLTLSVISASFYPNQQLLLVGMNVPREFRLFQCSKSEIKQNYDRNSQYTKRQIRRTASNVSTLITFEGLKQFTSSFTGDPRPTKRRNWENSKTIGRGVWELRPKLAIRKTSNPSNGEQCFDVYNIWTARPIWLKFYRRTAPTKHRP